MLRAECAIAIWLLLLYVKRKKSSVFVSFVTICVWHRTITFRMYIQVSVNNNFAVKYGCFLCLMFANVTRNDIQASHFPCTLSHNCNPCNMQSVLLRIIRNYIRKNDSLECYVHFRVRCSCLLRARSFMME